MKKFIPVINAVIETIKQNDHRENVNEDADKLREFLPLMLQLYIPDIDVICYHLSEHYCKIIS